MFRNRSLSRNSTRIVLIGNLLLCDKKAMYCRDIRLPKRVFRCNKCGFLSAIEVIIRSFLVLVTHVLVTKNITFVNNNLNNF